MNAEEIPSGRLFMSRLSFIHSFINSTTHETNHITTFCKPTHDRCRLRAFCHQRYRRMPQLVFVRDPPLLYSGSSLWWKRLVGSIPDRKAALLILVIQAISQPRLESPCPRDSFQRASIHIMHRTLISSLLLLVGVDPPGVLQGRVG